MEERSEENFYSFEAEYPQLNSEQSAARAEVNLCIAAFITHAIQRFRAQAMQTSPEKTAMQKTAFQATGWDALSISHKVSLFTNDLLSIEFSVWSYGAGAAHPNRKTRTLNFQLNPPMRLQLEDVFNPSTDYLQLLSEYCVSDLRSQRSHGLQEQDEWLEKKRDEWILSGAGPKVSNYEQFVVVSEGVRVFFDEYRVGSYAEGRYEVFIPTDVLRPVLSESVTMLLGRKLG